MPPPPNTPNVFRQQSLLSALFGPFLVLSGPFLISFAAKILFLALPFSGVKVADFPGGGGEVGGIPQDLQIVLKRFENRSKYSHLLTIRAEGAEGAYEIGREKYHLHLTPSRIARSKVLIKRNYIHVPHEYLPLQ